MGWWHGASNTLLILTCSIISFFHLINIMKKSEDNNPKRELQTCTTNKILLRMSLGGIFGALLFLCVAWLYIIFIKESSATLHPIAILGSLCVAFVGFVVGALLSLFSKKWHQPVK